MLWEQKEDFGARSNPSTQSPSHQSLSNGSSSSRTSTNRTTTSLYLKRSDDTTVADNASLGRRLDDRRVAAAAAVVA